MQEMQVRSLGQKDPLEKEMATHSGILAWEIPGTEESGRLQSMGLQASDITRWLNHHHHQIRLQSKNKLPETREVHYKTNKT